MSAGIAPDASLCGVTQWLNNVLTEERDATERHWLLTENPTKGVPHDTTLLGVKVAQCVQAPMAAPATRTKDMQQQQLLGCSPVLLGSSQSSCIPRVHRLAPLRD